MSRRGVVRAGVVLGLVVCTAVPGRSQRRAIPAGGPHEHFEVVKLFASDAQSDLQFGSSVDVDGNVAVVGAIQKAYVFRNRGGQWVEEQILQPPDQSSRPLSVAVDDDVIAVGASRPPVPGAVTIYRYDGAQWSQEARLRYCCSNQAFGWSVDLNAGVLAVGDPDTWIMGSGVIGSVYVFRHRSGSWEPEAFLLGTFDDAKFGYTVSVSGDRLLVGVPFVQSSIWPAYADLFWFDGTSWRFLQRIEEPNGVKGTHMGSAVALTGDAALISDPAADPESLVDAGVPYLFRNAPEDPRRLQRVRASTSGHANARHGQEVALSSDIALIGERGLVRVRRVGANGWPLVTSLRTGPQLPSNGRYLATNGRSHWIGQPYDGERGERAGAVLVLQPATLALSASSTTIAAGGTLSLRVRGGEPFASLGLALTEWDGAPTFLPLPADFVDLDGTPGAELRIPPELAGHALGLTLFGSSGPARWVGSDVLRLEVTP